MQSVMRSNYPRVAEIILKSTYLDDSMDSVIEGVKLYTGVVGKSWDANPQMGLEFIQGNGEHSATI